jgi:DNA (cytosine-5)-methyltransferase 1
MASAFPIVDIFAGPGGLGEGFSAYRDKRGKHPFQIALSVEKEPSAFDTLRLRSFLRQFTDGFPKEYYEFINQTTPEPDWAHLYPKQWKAACREALKLELGTANAKAELRPRLSAICANASGRSILIGGPPCQAYSLVGRARNRGIDGYEARDDRRHFLYREYIQVIDQLRPAIFVMENVKGMISASVDGTAIFELILSDLRDAGGKRKSYRLYSLLADATGSMKVAAPVDPKSFIVRTESFGVPQSRHRIIVLGVRSDITWSPPASSITEAEMVGAQREVVRNVLDGLPRLRSGLSSDDSNERWKEAILECLSTVAALSQTNNAFADISRRAKDLLKEFRKKDPELHRSISRQPRIGARTSAALRNWTLDPNLRVAPNNIARTHMRSDLARYMFASIFGEVRGHSPKASDFPKNLSPSHRNWKTGKFADRFRVQVYDRPSSTITSHISKDGHYFIHPDPLQCRSLTVREAARLQTFPDNYFFKGNRTQQYVQVGNAVPPYLALQIAEVVASIMKKCPATTC